MGTIITLEDFYGILTKEINWCYENFDSIDMEQSYKFGYIEGLKQAQNMIIDFEISVLKKEKNG